MAEIAYQDFDLSLERAPGGFRAAVRNSPAGAATSEFVLPFDSVRLENYILRLGRVRRGVRRLETPETQAARELGGALFQAVFAGEVRACLRSSLDDTRRRGQGLRLRLHVNAPELWGLPWEYLYYPTRNQFLALSVHSPLVRYIELAEPVPVLAVEPPLRVLTMISSPTDHPALDVEREWRLLNEAVGTLHPARRVVLERLEEPTLSALQRRLRRSDYHVFHFIGHGGYDQEKDEGVLLLEDEDRKGDVVSSRHLGMLLHDHRPLRVAVLNACEGARSSLVDPFAGSAQTLVQQGLPAVIAMQFEIGDEVATTFAQELYGALSDGYPIDAAVTESRKAIFTSGHEVAWGTPVLYMRTPDGRIFDVKGTGHPVPGLGVPPGERRRPKAMAAGAGAGPASPAQDAGVDWGLASSQAELPREDPAVVDPVAVERKRLSEAKTLDPLEREPVKEPASFLDRAREHAAQGRHAEALHLVGQALAREPGSIEARVLKRHLLHAMGTSSTASAAGERLLTMARTAARSAAGVVAIVVLAILAFALASWRTPKAPETVNARQQATKPDQPLARPAPSAASGAAPADARRDRPASATTPSGASTTPGESPRGTGSLSAVGGTLVFDVPPGVDVSVNRRKRGRAPLAPLTVPAGVYAVAVQHPTLGIVRQRVTVSDGTRTSVTITEQALRETHATRQELLARRALDAGERERALRLVSDALVIAPSSSGLRAFLTQFAGDAMNGAIAARKAAERSSRARRSAAFAFGDSQFERAEKSHEAGRLTDAIPAYWTAQTQFERALKESK